MDTTAMRVYVCARDAIYIYNRNAAGKMDIIEQIESLHPSYLAFHPERPFLYVSNEVADFNGKTSGVVTTYAVAPASGRLAMLGQELSGGQGPCHLSLAKTAGCVYVANYADGSIAVLPVCADGRLGALQQAIKHHGASVIASRQSSPHAHCIIPDPTGAFVLVCDLGVDKVYIYRSSANGTLQPSSPPWVSLPPGSGPRHMVFHPNGRYLYVINELISRLDVFTFDSTEGLLSLLQSVPAIPAGFAETNYCSAIWFHPTGKFLYASNRGMETLAIFRVDAESGILESAGYADTGGKWPRDFAIDASGRILVAGNQHSDTLVGYNVDLDTGALEPLGVLAQVPHPICVQIRN